MWMNEQAKVADIGRSIELTLKIPTGDMVEIIRGIERNGKLHARLIIE